MGTEADVAQRVLVVMPTTPDATRTADLLQGAGIGTKICNDLTELVHELRTGGGGALLITDTVLASDAQGQLAHALRGQPTWSTIPVLLIVREGTQYDAYASTLGTDSVIVVERPVRLRPLLSVVRSALRSRRHQYEIRDAIAARDQQAASIAAQEERLRFALDAGRLGSWSLDPRGMQLQVSDLCRANYGRPAGAPFGFPELTAALHPDDRDAVLGALQRSIDTNASFDVEYRVLWPNGEVHWIMVRGQRATHDPSPTGSLVGVSLDITETKRMHQALQQSQLELARHAEQLVNADRRKDDFLATLAHELRNPLAPIRTGMDVLRTVAEESTRRTLDVMDRQLSHMVRLIDDLLDVSRITRGKLELKRSTVTLGSVLDAALEACRPHMERKAHNLVVVVDDSELVLDVDATRLSQVVSNLLINAAKYTQSRGQIELSARRIGAQLQIEVRDNGAGIPSERLGDVFEMFSQVDSRPQEAQAGLGIGLALVRSLVELHGGTVQASSPGLGLGSTFTVRVPVRAAAPAPGPASKEAPAPAPAPARCRVLVVDDNLDAAELLSLLLEQDGYSTLTAHTGQEALDVAARHAPEIVILDIGLPDMSGYDVARQLRSNPRSTPLGLIALTGWGTAEDKNKAKAAGFDVHLTKPVDADQLHAALVEVERLLRRVA